MDKLLSKEKTLQKELVTNFMRVSNALPYIHKAMDEYSKQMAIGFAEWIWENGWVRCYYDGGYHGYYDSNILTEGSTTEITVNELYYLFEKYLQSIN